LQVDEASTIYIEKEQSDSCIEQRGEKINLVASPFHDESKRVTVLNF